MPFYYIIKDRSSETLMSYDVVGGVFGWRIVVKSSHKIGQCDCMYYTMYTYA